MGVTMTAVAEWWAAAGVAEAAAGAGAAAAGTGAAATGAGAAATGVGAAAAGATNAALIESAIGTAGYGLSSASVGASGGFWGSVGNAAASAAAGQLVGKAMEPKPKEPFRTPMPDPLAQQEARRKAIVEQVSRRGRASTILSDLGNNKLGG